MIIKEEIVSTEEYAFIKCNWVIQILFIFTISSLKDECKCQIEAINTLIAFCCLQKARRPHCLKPSALDIKLEQDPKLPSVLNLSSLSDSILIKPKSTQYIFYLNKERLPALIYLKFFYSLDNLKKHFQRKYLCYHSNSKLITCFYLKDNIELESKMQL